MKRKIIVAILLIGLAVGGYYGYNFYKKSYASNVVVENGKTYIFIKTGWNENDVAEMLLQNKLIKDKESFLWLAQKMSYTGKSVEPGKYNLEDGWSNKRLIEELRGAAKREVTIPLEFNNVRTLDQLAEKIEKEFEFTKEDFLNYLLNEKTLDKYGFNKYTIMTMFIPNKYEIAEWDSSPEELVARIAKEYKKFWEPYKGRGKELAATGLTQSQVSILASIVQAEQSSHLDEQPKIAGLYLNRLRSGIKLQSDPTVIYAIGDFSIRRVLNKHLTYDSPFNTYVYKGLPPGPINLPEISAIKAVLNYDKNKFIYMCAKPGAVGYHNFARTEAEHMKNAREFHAWLDKNGY